MGKGFQVDSGGGEVVDHIRYCPVCGRIGNMAICGPHQKKGVPLCANTLRHPDEALQAAFRMGGLQAAAEYAKELSITTPRQTTMASEAEVELMSTIISFGQKAGKK